MSQVAKSVIAIALFVGVMLSVSVCAPKSNKSIASDLQTMISQDSSLGNVKVDYDGTTVTVYAKQIDEVVLIQVDEYMKELEKGYEFVYVQDSTTNK